MKNIVITYLFLSLFFAVYGQQSADITVSCSFTNTPFTDFVKDLEKRTPLKFYYLEDLTKDVSITFSGTNVPVVRILDDQIAKSGLKYFVDDNNIYIFKGDPIINELPAFKLSDNEFNNSDSLQSITESERKYLDGRMISSVEVLEIGDKQKSDGTSNCIVTGKIIDFADSEPLIGATIYIEEQKISAATDLDGRFKLALKPGKYKAVFNYMSMKQQEFYLQIYSGGFVTIEMKKELIALNEVKVTANRFDNVKGVQMGFERISSKAMKEIPIAFGEKDVLKVAQMLPGVLNVGEGSSGFNVRGSSEDQNMFYINRIPVYNTSHLFGFFTSFNPDIINDFSFYKSNIPARFGGRLSSVFDITTRQGNKRKFYGQGGISPITAHTSIEIPAIKNKVSIVTSFRTSYSDWLLKKIKDKNIKKSSASFYDGSFSVNAEINDKNLLKTFMYQSHDQFSLSTLNEYEYSNRGASIIWKHIFSPVVSVDFSAIYSGYSFENADKTNLSNAYKQSYNIDHYEARADFSLLNKANHKIEFGASGIYYGLDRGNILPYNDKSFKKPVNLGYERGLESAVYFSDEFALTPNIIFSGGLRYSMFNVFGPSEINLYNSEDIKNTTNIKGTKNYGRGDVIKSYSGPEYRFSFNYNLGQNSSLKASYNRLHQYIFMLKSTISISPDDKWKLVDYHIAPPVADQIAAGYYRNFNNGGIEVSLELYNKIVHKQVEFKDGADFTSPDPIETKVLQGIQRANGVEAMLRKNSGKTTGWISYCYSRSFVEVDGGNKENQINKGIEYPSNYDRPHSFNVVMNFRTNRRLSLSTNFVYTTGRPVTLPVSVYYAEGQQLLNFSNRNEFRIPDYARLDVSINLEGNLFRKKPIHSSWSLNLYNALGRENAYSVYFDSDKGVVKGHKLSIFGVPIVTLSWNYKFGNYLND